MDEPKRWAVPRPGPDGEPLGILRVEVVPAAAYDRLRDTLDRAEAEDPVHRPWRNGRSVGRTVYAVAGDTPSDDDTLIGVMDTVELAREVVLSHNQAGGWNDRY